ncbi:MAG: hypothetical protein ABI620_00710 [Chloroflexota bacterium]
MATTAIEGAYAPPYAPSWLNRLLAFIERQAWPAWLTYTVLSLVSIVASHTQLWTTGEAPPWSFTVAYTYYGILPFALLWAVGYLDRVAASAFDTFRPALTVSPGELERLRYELTVIPAVPALVLAIITFALTATSYALDPVASDVVGLSAPVLAVRLVFEAFNGAVAIVIVYQLLRQMRQVRSLLARSTRVDLFQPGPLYAFSKLTSRTGIVLVVFVASSAIVAPLPVDSGVFLWIWAPWLIAPSVIAAIAFLVPLQGMHDRLVAEKERLQDEAEQRLKSVLQDINRSVDAGDLSRADAQNKSLATMIQQRDVLAKLPTWPWSTGTLRAFVTAILLPLGLFLIQRVLTQLV